MDLVSHITFVEQFNGASFIDGPNPSWEIKYEAKGDSDRLKIRDEAKLQLASTYDEMPRQEITITAFGANDEWLVSVSYSPASEDSGSPPPPETGDSLFTFDTAGGTEHITQSLGTSFSIAPQGQQVPDFHGAIGVTKNGVAGIDITVPVYQFKETHYIEAATVTEAYKKILSTLTGKVNNAVFRGYAIGEVLFLGASGSFRENQEDWEISFSFAQSDNRDDLVVESMTGIQKKGWENLEVHYEEEVDSKSNTMVMKPTSVIVHKIFELLNFGAMGI